MANVWKEKETPKGIVKYRKPRIDEGYEFIALGTDWTGVEGFLKVKAKYLRKIGELGMVDFSATGHKSFEEILEDGETMGPTMVAITNEIYDDVNEIFKKKG